MNNASPAAKNVTSNRRTVIVTGASGMIGSALSKALESRGDRVLRITRRPRGPRDIPWNPSTGQLDLAEHEPIHAAIHLAGENIAARRWSWTQKRQILDSRVHGTSLLSAKLASLKQTPSVLLSASGVNYYPSNTGSVLDESATAGTGFLSEVCEAWEGATRPASEAGIRVAQLRLGVVMSNEGGALSKLLPLFKLGVGGRLGSGKQRMPWIALEDVLAIILAAVDDDRFSGPFNLVAPDIVTNAGFTDSLARALHRPALIPVPPFALRLRLGDLADEALLADLAVAPKRLLELGYQFRHPKLQEALTVILNSSAGGSEP